LGLSSTLPTGGIMSGIDFKSFLIGVLITIIFVFTTGISIGGGGKYVVSCAGSSNSTSCFILNVETGVGKHVQRSKQGVLKAGAKPDF
jgi:hypothetical protein